MREINSKLSFHVIYMSSNERTRNFDFVLKIEKTKKQKTELDGSQPRKSVCQLSYSQLSLQNLYLITTFMKPPSLRVNSSQLNWSNAAFDTVQLCLEVKLDQFLLQQERIMLPE